MGYQEHFAALVVWQAAGNPALHLGHQPDADADGAIDIRRAKR